MLQKVMSAAHKRGFYNEVSTALDLTSDKLCLEHVG